MTVSKLNSRRGAALLIIFSQRPQSNAPVWNWTVSEPDQFDQGYIFIGPYQHVAAGPYIYDKFGNLVWDGFGQIGPTNAHDFRPCQYKGEPHLCITAVNQQLGYGFGNGCTFSEASVMQSVY